MGLGFRVKRGGQTGRKQEGGLTMGLVVKEGRA